MKVVAVVGPRQSGSTLFFNLIRLILASSNHTVDACWIDLYKKGLYKSNVDYLIVKCHDFDEGLNNATSLILLPLRDFRDSAVSFHKRFNNLKTIRDIIGYIHQNIKQYNDWESYASLKVMYENYMVSKEYYIDKIAKWLGVEIRSGVKESILFEIDTLHKGCNCPNHDKGSDEDRMQMAMNDEIYKVTLMTKNHNTSNGSVGKYKIEMPTYAINKINFDTKISSFLIKHRYL